MTNSAEGGLIKSSNRAGICDILNEDHHEDHEDHDDDDDNDGR